MGSCDVIVVGAGPAGSIVAYDCARAGLRTLLLEKATLPREKPCGGAVMYRGLRILGNRLPRRLVEQKIHGLRFVLPSGRRAEFLSDKLIGITTRRSTFDEYLAHRAADAGAELLEESRVARAQVNEGSAQVMLSDGREFSSRIIVGADGASSIVAKMLGLRPEHKDLTRVGLGMEADFHLGEEGVLKATQGNPSILEIVPVQGRTSYGWVFPKRAHLGIGIAGAAVHMTHLRPEFDRFVRATEQRLKVPLPITERRTCFLGADGITNRNVTDRAILIGDAAGFVDPAMGEGIAYAMKSGVLAAQVIIQAAEQDRYDMSFLSKYDRLCIKEFKASFGVAEWAGMRGASLAESLLPRASGFKLSSDVMAMLARGEIDYSGIPVTVLRKMPRRLPAFIRRYVQTRLSSSK
ncbi:MAG: hypothetical protein C4K49_04130 [Candidatus Thorarchaeota archaeon]|nr:MAG: hypothetical protein C4K49_04130 [Candidatus Thorarchaeota archaeon]